MQSNIYWFIFLICAVLYLLSYAYAKKLKDTSKYLTNLPGPKPTFPFGNTLYFIQGSTVLIPQLIAFLDTFGDTVLLHDGAFSWGVLTRDYAFNELLYRSSIHIDKVMQYSFLSRWLGSGLLTSSGTKWKSHRKAITPAFHFNIVQNYIDIFNGIGDTLIGKLTMEVGKPSVEISKMISLYALDVICEAAMGVKINALEQQNSKYIKSIKKMCKIIVERTFSCIHPELYQFTWNYYQENKALKTIHEHVNSVISTRIAERDSTKIGVDPHFKRKLAFLDLLLESKVDGKPLTLKELQDEVNTFMFEGHDTTSSAIGFAIFLLATHSQVQEKVQKEQIELFGENPTSLQPTHKQLNEMKYLEMVIKETLRLYPSIPFYGRKLATELEFGGDLYPKGMQIMLIPFACHRNAKHFPEPEKFLPERFENYNGTFPFAYTPFSAGPRNCIGQKFAMLKMLAVLSKIVRNFQLRPATPEHKLQLAAETILISKNGIRISLTTR